MAFFDEIANKGKAFADLAKLKSALSDEEKKVESTYNQIGKLYVALHPQDSEPDLSGLVNSVISSQERISQYKQQIQQVKGVVICASCGAEVPNNVAFCTSCGAPMPRRQPVLDANHIRCDGCGAIVDKNLRFCISCGKLLVNPAPVAAPEYPSAPDQSYADPGGIITDNTAAAPEDYSGNSVAGYQQPYGFETSVPDQSYVNPGVIEPEIAAGAPGGYQPPFGGEAPVINTCPSCGAVLRDNTKFCTTCGFQLPSSDTDVFSSSQPGAVFSDKKECPLCGAMVDSDLAFCVECGAPLL